jgi:SAM-dependent methyltransferase
MERLTTKESWDDRYKNTSAAAIKKKSSSSEGWRKYFQHYYQYLLWATFRRYLPQGEGLRVLEVGSAPGKFLVKLHEMFNYIPYGVEYSGLGVTKNKDLFRLNNLDPDKVIQADFFDSKFQDKYQGYFDIVISMGFIEHFTDAVPVVEKHLNVLKDGGYLVISIPNLNRQGFYGKWSSLFSKERLEIHNTDIMIKDNFKKLFDNEKLHTLSCGYFGTVHLGLIKGGGGLIQRVMVPVCRRLQMFLNPLLVFILREKGAESKFFSPLLLYIGRKKEMLSK